MLSLISEPRQDSLMIHVRELWKKAKRPIAFGLLILITLAKYTPVQFLQSAAISALGFIIMSHLFELVDLASSSRRRVSFEDVADAKETILQYVREAHARDGYVKIQWLGMTMFNVWSILTFALNELAAESCVTDLTLEVAMLSSDWLSDNVINPAWTGDRATTTATDIAAYFADKKPGLNWRYQINSYRHMPGIHGGLINGKYLFLGVCQWTGSGVLQAGECPYYLYTFKDLEDQKKIEIFSGWFQYCSTPKARMMKAS